MMEQVVNNLSGMHFYQALIIVFGIFFADMLVGILAAWSSGRKIKSGVMVLCQSKKLHTFFAHIIIAVSFYFAAQLGKAMGAENVEILGGFATIVVAIPAIPEIISIVENFKIMKTKIDTKQKEEKEE